MAALMLVSMLQKGTFKANSSDQYVLQTFFFSGFLAYKKCFPSPCFLVVTHSHCTIFAYGLRFATDIFFYLFCFYLNVGKCLLKHVQI